jgi:hypothetical protein
MVTFVTFKTLQIISRQDAEDYIYDDGGGGG